jgi:hypothetical protein
MTTTTDKELLAQMIINIINGSATPVTSEDIHGLAVMYQTEVNGYIIREDGKITKKVITKDY